MNINVRWTGNYPNLCHGKWIIQVNDKFLTLPDGMADRPMNTLKVYSYWHFDEHWSEHWEDDTSGLTFEEWIKVNAAWIKESLKNAEIDPRSFTDADMQELYDQINDVDWNHGTCGGCI